MCEPVRTGRKGYNDVPGSETQPVGPKAFVESEKAFVPPRLHESVQRTFIKKVSGEHALVHHPRPHYVHGVGGECSCQAARKTGTAERTPGGR